MQSKDALIKKQHEAEIIVNKYVLDSFIFESSSSIISNYFETYLIDAWLELYPKGNIIALDISNMTSNRYSFEPFTNFLIDFDNTIKQNIKSIVSGGARGIPYFGDLIASIINIEKDRGTLFANDEAIIMKTIIKRIGKKNAVFIVKHYSKWDISSRILLDKIINKYKNNDNIQFIFINDTKLTGVKFPTYSVSNFSREESSYLLKNEISNITDMQVKTIFSILNGEIDHTLHAIDIINLHGYSRFIQQLDNIEYISKTISNAYSIQDSQKLIELLKRASVIGDPAHKKLLFILTEYQRSLFLHMIDIATKNDYLIDCEKSVSYHENEIYYSRIFLA